MESFQSARLWKWPTDLRIVAGERAVHGEKTGCDFFGYTAAGRVVMIECKMRNKGTLGLGQGRDVNAYQWTELLFCHRAGGVALICWQKGQEIATIDMDIAHRLSVAEGRISIPWSSIPAVFVHAETDVDQLLEPYLTTAYAACSR